MPRTAEDISGARRPLSQSSDTYSGGTHLETERAMTRQEAGRLGGLRTVEIHGREHMSLIGKRGFARLATFANGGRLGAFARLTSQGKLTPRRPIVELTVDQEHD